MPQIVIARIKAKEDKIEEVKQGLKSILDPTRKEAGCLHYDLHQSSEDTTLFYTYEKWQDVQAHRQHLQAPHIQGLMKAAASLLAEPPEIQCVRLV